MEAKWFSTSLDGALYEGRGLYQGEAFFIVETDIVSDLFKRSLSVSDIDGSGPGVCVDRDDLPSLTPIMDNADVEHS